MKKQEDLYKALEKVESTMRVNDVKGMIDNASRMTMVISAMTKHAEKEPNDIMFKHVAFDVIRTYASLLDETIDDIHSITVSVNAAVISGLSEPEAEKGETA